MADIFISYTSSDRDWAFWIAKELETLGHKPRIHEWEISGGGDIAAWMEQRHDPADHVPCVVSWHTLRSLIPAWERHAAQWAAASERPNFVLPVFVEPCEVPTLFAHLNRCDLYGIAEDEARERLKPFLRRRRPNRHGNYFRGDAKPRRRLGPDRTFPGKARGLQHPDPRADAFHRPRRRARGDRHGAQALRGPRRHHGAARAARGRQDHARGGLCRAASRRLPRDLVDQGADRADACAPISSALGVRLGWVGADEKEEPALAAVMERLRHEGEGILLIFDNAIDANALKPYLPRGGAAQVLVTSNAHAWRGVAAPVEIRLWPKEIGADYLIARTGRDGRARGGRGSVGGARRPAARARAGGGLLRAARNVRLPNTAGGSRRRRRDCSTTSATRRPSITTA